MKTRFVMIASLAAATAALSLPATAQDSEKAKPTKGEVELAEILDGYAAGEPVKCLRRTQHDRLQIVDETAFVFRDGRTIYVNRTNAPRYIDDFDLPVFKPFGSSLCRSDRVEMVSRAGGIAGPIITLSEFIPYTKVETES